MMKMGNLFYHFLSAPSSPDPFPEPCFRAISTSIPAAATGGKAEGSSSHSVPIIGLTFHLDKMVGGEREGVQIGNKGLPFIEDDFSIIRIGNASYLLSVSASGKILKELKKGVILIPQR